MSDSGTEGTGKMRRFMGKEEQSSNQNKPFNGQFARQLSTEMTWWRFSRKCINILLILLYRGLCSAAAS